MCRDTMRKTLESDMTIALRTIGINLNIGMSFEKSLENVAKGNHGQASLYFQKILNDIYKAGTPVTTALHEEAIKSKSQNIKRALLYLTSAYENASGKGYDGDPLITLSKEQLQQQKIKMKETSNQLVFYSLIFIIASAVLPAMFQVLTTIGSQILKLTFTPEQVLMTTILGFPAVNTAIILLINRKIKE